MKMFKSVISVVLCLMMLLVSSAALAQDGNLNAPGVEPICKETVKLRIGLPLHPYITDFYTNYMTTELQRIGNYEFEFVYFSDKNEMAQKINMMAMGDTSDLPDIIMTDGSFSVAQTVQWADAGTIIPLNEYYENSTYYIDQSMENTGVSKKDMLKYVTAPDGNIYGIYRFNQSLLNEQEERLFIYKPWLDKLGLAVPTTIDEFYEALVAFRDQDPNGNGEKDEIPLITDVENLIFDRRALANYLMTCFVYSNAVSNGYFNIQEDGSLQAAYASDGWRDGLRFMNKLLNEGLFSDLSFSIDKSQLKVLMSEETTRVGACSGTVSDYLSATDIRRVEYYVLPPLEGPAGRFTSTNYSMPEIAMVITSACKNPEAAFRLGDLMCSSYFSVMTRWGQEGVDWVKPGEGEKSMFAALGYDALIKAISSWNVEQNQWWAQMGPYIRDYSYGAGMVASDNPYDTQIKLAETLAEYIALGDRSKSIGTLVYSEEEQEIVNEYEPTIQTYVRECFSLFINGEMDIETQWESYLEQLSAMGLEELTQAKQSAYQRMN